jgi:hypothetical protein
MGQTQGQRSHHAEHARRHCLPPPSLRPLSSARSPLLSLPLRSVPFCSVRIPARPETTGGQQERRATEQGMRWQERHRRTVMPRCFRVERVVCLLPARATRLPRARFCERLHRSRARRCSGPILSVHQRRRCASVFVRLPAPLLFSSPFLVPLRVRTLGQPGSDLGSLGRCVSE